MAVTVPVLHAITRLIVGGAQENTMYTAALLDKSRFQVEVVSGPQTGREGSLLEEVRQRGVALTILPDLVRQIHPLHDLRALIKLTRLMNSRGYQIVHTHSSKAGILGRLAARLANVPVIVHSVHGWSFHPHMSPWTRRIYILLERIAASYTDALVVVAESDIDKGLQAGIGRAGQYHLIRSAIPLEEFNREHVDRQAVRRELGLPADAIVLGNVGRFSPQKNPLDWVRVAARVGEALPGCHFLLVGDGPLRSQVEALIAEEGLSDRTILTGLRRDVAELIAAMDVFLLTSLWEGLPRVIPQALAMGVPVIANRADGTIEAVGEGESGFLCPPGDLDCLASRCLELLQDAERRKTMGTCGWEFALKEFDLQRMVSQIADLYGDLLSQTRGIRPNSEV
jgi:glycosyltransferase involved in cell wall biosynthesis